MIFDSLLNFDPLLSPVDESQPELNEFILYRCFCLTSSSSLRRAKRAFSKSATENIFALVSCELNRLSFGLLPSRLDWTICNGKFVCDDVNADDDFVRFVCCCTVCGDISGAGD